MEWLSPDCKHRCTSVVRLTKHLTETLPDSILSGFGAERKQFPPKPFGKTSKSLAILIFHLADRLSVCPNTAMRNTFAKRLPLAALLLGLFPGIVHSAENPFIGDWELTIPGGHAGWLGVDQSGDKLSAGMLWGWGSVEPTASAKLADGKLVVTRLHNIETKDASGAKRKVTLTETITATLDGSNMKLVSIKERENSNGADRAEFTGKRTAPMPEAPDLKSVKFGPPIQLFNGKDTSGWRLTDPGAVNGWSAKDGLLVNNPHQEDGKPHLNYGNLRTEGEFEDFRLKLEVRLAKGGNSGVYLRGIYEVQVAETYGKPLDSHNMGGLYSRIKPAVSAEKPPGEWQTMDITLVKRHLTVILNGKTLIANQPVRGCTGGALWSDVSRPGPLYLQGDHTGVEYRNISVTPVLP